MEAVIIRQDAATLLAAFVHDQQRTENNSPHQSTFICFCFSPNNAPRFFEWPNPPKKRSGPLNLKIDERGDRPAFESANSRNGQRWRSGNYSPGLEAESVLFLDGTPQLTQPFQNGADDARPATASSGKKLEQGPPESDGVQTPPEIFVLTPKRIGRGLIHLQTPTWVVVNNGLRVAIKAKVMTRL